jgi:arylsulfatase A-like enzyme
MTTTHPSRPHVVIFNPDSYRGDVLGHLGNAGAVTPNVDAMMAQGAVSYANAFAQNPVCTPSRCSFMTGWYPHTFGHRSMRHMLRDHEPHLLKVLMREGYKVWWGGKNDLAAVTTRADFLNHCHVKYMPEPARGRRTTINTGPEDPRWKVFYRGVHQGQGEDWPFVDSDSGMVRGAAAFIADANPAEPMCLFLPLTGPHPEYATEQDFYDMIDPARLPPRLGVPEHDLPALDALRQAYESARISEEDWLHIKRVYYAMCTKIDTLFGQVVQALKNKGIYDNTLIIFMSDHGDFAGDYALPEKTHFSLQDALIRVPLAIKPPEGVATQPGVRQSLVELVDMCPTIYDMLDIDPGYTTQGRSLRASLAGDDSPLRECVFSEVGSRANEKAFLNIDVHHQDPLNFYSIQSKASSPVHLQGSYAITARSVAYKYVRRPYVDHDELYDLHSDPGELHNLAGQQAYAHIEQTMANHLLDHFMLTADVLRHDQDSRRV